MLAAQVAPLVGADALAAVEYLDGAGGNPHVDFGAEQLVWDRIEEVMDLDVIVEVDPRTSPFRKLPIIGGQCDEGLALDLLEQLTTADAELAHGALVHALHDKGDGFVAFGKREESQLAQATQNVGLGESYSGFDFGLIARFCRTCWEDSDGIMRGHRAVGAVDSGS